MTARKGETGLLTRFVPEKLKHTAIYRWLLRLTRVLQFLSAVISLAIFSSRIYKIYRLVNSAKAYRGLDHANAAVEGILAAAVLYTLVATIMMCLMRGGGPTWMRWMFVILDLLFVGAFIAVAILTSPNGGFAGPRHCYNARGQNDNNNNNNGEDRDDSCNLPWSTFILAIISTILHAITAAFNEVKDRYHQHQSNKHAHDKELANNGHGNGNGQYENGQHANGQHLNGQHVNGHDNGNGMTQRGEY